MDTKLLEYMWEKKYKQLCDIIKIEILNKFIGLCLEREKRKKGQPILTKFDLILIKDKIEELQEKDIKKERKSIVNVINNLAKRGNNEIPK